MMVEEMEFEDDDNLTLQEAIQRIKELKQIIRSGQMLTITPASAIKSTSKKVILDPNKLGSAQLFLAIRSGKKLELDVDDANNVIAYKTQ